MVKPQPHSLLSVRPRSLDALACPSCLSQLTMSVDPGYEVEDGVLECPKEALQYPVKGGVPMLVRPSSSGRVQAFEASYSLAWSRDGWGSADEEYLFRLPAKDVTGRHETEWRVKARSMEVLFRVLDRKQLRRVIDLGCGMGWLSHHLALRGNEVYAVDILRDDQLGLGAAGRYARRGPFFERIWGELERPPFRDSCSDAVICNASLHYASDTLAVLREISRILKPGGLFVLLNSPVHSDALSAVRARDGFRRRLQGLGATDDVVSRYQHFTRDMIAADVQSLVGPVEDAGFDPGFLFLLGRRFKGFALRMELASFPLLYATKTDSAARS